MMLVNLKTFSKELGLTEETVNAMTIGELNKLLQAKEDEKKKAREVDPSFARIVKVYCTLVEPLNKWWSEDEIVQAAANTGCTIRDFVSETFIPMGENCCYTPNDFLRTSWETVPRYTKKGEQLMEGERKRVDVYQVRSQYQHLRHGKIILNLLYHKYPELEKYNFAAYGFDHGSFENYELYPGKIPAFYVPFEAIMDGNIDRIIKRNKEFATFYNYGEYTPEKMNERLASNEVQEFFNCIRNLPR